MPRAFHLRLAALALAVGGLWLAHTQQPPADLSLEKLADDLYVLVGSGGNVAVYTTDEGAILVDDKFEQNVPQIVAKVKSITDKPIRYVWNTHHHGDHSGGNQKLLAFAEILAHTNARANIVKNSQPGAPRITFGNEAAIALGGKEVRARYFGAGPPTATQSFISPRIRSSTPAICLSAARRLSTTTTAAAPTPG
jgi:cyclase